MTKPRNTNSFSRIAQLPVILLVTVSFSAALIVLAGWDVGLFIMPIFLAGWFGLAWCHWTTRKTSRFHRWLIKKSAGEKFGKLAHDEMLRREQTCTICGHRNRPGEELVEDFE